jgi:hypothetical protein
MCQSLDWNQYLPFEVSVLTLGEISPGHRQWKTRLDLQTLAARINPANPDHHLWNNNGTWWCHFTVHRDDFTKQRIRRSLRTTCLIEARRLRDAILLLQPSFDH